MFLPKRPVLALAAHIKHSKVKPEFVEIFDFETDRGCELLLLLVFGFKAVDEGGLAAVVQADYDDV